MKRKCLKITTALVMVLSIIMIFRLYSVKNAETIVTRYYENIQKQDYEGAYKYVSKETKEDISLNKFKKLYTLRNEFEQIQYIDTNEGRKSNGIVTIPIRINAVYVNDNEGKVAKYNLEHKLIAEKANYKLILEPSDFNKKIAQAHIDYVWEKYIWRNDIDSERAISSINEAIELDKDNPDIYYTTAKIAEKSEDALYLLDKAIELSNKRDYWHLSYVYNMKGDILREKDDLEGAKANYSLAIEEDKENQIASSNLKEINELLGADNNINNTVHDELKKKEIIKETKETKLNKEDLTSYDKTYITRILSIMEDYYTGLSNIDKLLSDPEPDSASWSGELVASVLFINLICDDVDNTLAPDKFKRMHKEIYFAGKHYRLAMENLLEAVDNLDSSSSGKYTMNIEQASERMEKANEELIKMRKEYEF